VLFGLWANLHGGFLAGLGIVLVWICVRMAAALASRRRAGGDRLHAAAIAALAATLLNPYGVRLLAFLAAPRSLDPRSPSGSHCDRQHLRHTYLVFVALAVAALAYEARAKVDHARRVLLLAFLPCSPLDTALLALGTPLLLGEHLSGVGSLVAAPGRPGHPRPLAVLAVVVAVALLWAALPRFGCIRIDPALAIGYPARAVATLRASGVQGNLAIPFGWGEYAIWYLPPRIKVSEDGRRETVYSDAVLAENLQFAAGVGNWDALLRERDTHLALVHRSHAAFNLMKLYPGWVLAYEDTGAAIFAREGSPMVARIHDVIPPALPADGAGLCFP
jgi:hypothetical protein